jgi:histone H3/H4
MTEFISRGRIIALARRAGIKRVSALFSEEVAGKAVTFLRNIVGKAANTIMSGKTLSAKNVELVAPTTTFSDKISIKKCGDRKAKKSNVDKDIEHYQNCDGLIFSRAPFARLVKSLLSQFVATDRVSSNALTLLQYTTEAHLLNLLEQAAKIAEHRKCLTVTDRDVHLADMVSSELGNKKQSGPNIERMENFTLYIKRALKQFEPTLSISSDSVSQINMFINVLANRIACGARTIGENKTLGSKAIEISARNIFMGLEDLSDRVIKEARKSFVIKLLFPIPRVMRILRGVCKQRISMKAAVYLTGILQYISTDLVLLCAQACKTEKRKIINAKCLSIVVQEDDETYSDDFKKLFKSLGVAVIA